MPVEAVIFDLDGTLTNFNLDFKTLRAEVRSYLMRTGVPASVLNVSESIFEMLKKAEIFFKNNGKSGNGFGEVRNQSLAIAERFEMEAAATTSLMPGAYEALQEFRRMKLEIALCTTSGEKATNYILQQFKIAQFFGVVVTRNNVGNVKPQTDEFEFALKELNVSPEAALIVGDSVVDMQSAKELKAVAVGLPTGVSTMEQLKRNGANYVVTSLIDLPALVKEINKA